MCGVAGIVRLDGAGVSPDALAAMTACLVHRGPDDAGRWQRDGVGLGHRRLSVIDLEGSQQPMSTDDGRWTIVFNGEIFNYRDLRAQLHHPFLTQGDTETLLVGLATAGIGFVDRLVGQFAFVAYDAADRVLHLVRDRLGVLPLHYRHEGDQFLVGSEIKAVLAGMRQRPSVDLESLDSYLAGRSVPAPHTLFEGVRKVLPGHRIELDVDTGVTRQVRYWKPPPEDARRWSSQEAVRAVDEALTQAVASALVADVPVGAYLSGGIDSSLIVAKAAQLHGGRLKTFAAGFGDARHDELPFARRVSELFGTEHHEVPVDARDFEELWPVLTWHRDAPMSEPADFAVYRLAQAARQEVTVVLSGEGSDELFGGYPKYAAARMMAALSVVPGGLRESVGGVVDRNLPERLARARIATRVWGTRDRAAQLQAWFSPFTTTERAGLLAGVPSRSSDVGGHRGGDAVRAMLLADLGAWLPDNLLERGDRMSMATSLELRPPFLDHRLVELAFRLPSRVKVRGRQTKWVVKEVARRHLPAEIVDRRKVGFRVPLDAWFRTSLRETVRDRLTSPGGFVADTLDRTMVRELLDRHDSGSFNEDIRIWTLMSLEVWHDTFFRRGS